MLVAVKSRAAALRHASHDLRNDRAFALRQCGLINWRALQFWLGVCFEGVVTTFSSSSFLTSSSFSLPYHHFQEEEEEEEEEEGLEEGKRIRK